MLTVLSSDSFVDLAAQLDRAYIEACRKGTKQVFNGRIILAGYSDGGKTSLANRLLGEQINVDERNSTEGIVLHRIQSTFIKETKNKGGKWTKKSIETSDFISDFITDVWSRAQNTSEESNRDESLNSRKNNKNDDSAPTANKRRKPEKENPLPRLSLDIESAQATRQQTIPEEIIQELLNYKTIAFHQESNVGTPFTISIWDLGGQDEFISTHHLFLDSKATILIVMDITKSLHQLIGRNFELGYLNSTAEVLHYWLDLFHTDAAKHKIEPNIAIVLTHKDKMKGDQKKYIGDYVKGIMRMVKGKPYAKYISKDKIYTVSNVTDSDSDFQKL